MVDARMKKLTTNAARRDFVASALGPGGKAFYAQPDKKVRIVTQY